MTACPKTLKEITKEDARSVFILSFLFKSQKISGRLLKRFLWGIPQEMKLSQAKIRRQANSYSRYLADHRIQACHFTTEKDMPGRK